jgi:hypothetical protein
VAEHSGHQKEETPKGRRGEHPLRTGDVDSEKNEEQRQQTIKERFP